MIFEFTKDTIHPTVGKVIEASKECRRAIYPRGVRGRMSYILYSTNGNIIAEYSSSVRGYIKSMVKDMYQIQNGSIESICYPHPF